MASGSRTNDYRNANGYAKTMYTSRTRSMLSGAPRSNSAMSSRTFSRIKGNTPSKSSGSPRVQRSMNFDQNDSIQFDDSIVDMAELENEQELLKRMIDQQKQLQELKERQKRVLELQQQLASMEESAEYSMEEKLEKLKTAKTRLDELQKLVSTIKSVEADDKEGSGDNKPNTVHDKAQQVKQALEELSHLKSLISMVSETNDSPVRSKPKPAATLEPVFPHSVESDERMVAEYRPVLPEVSVVQYEDVQAESPKYFSRKKSSLAQKRPSKGRGKQDTGSPLDQSPYQNRKSSLSKRQGKTVRTVSPQKEEDTQASEKLLEEMRRHQVLLKELRERRQELEELMNMTRGTHDGEEELEVEREEDYNDTNASIRSNLGSPDESRGVSDDDDFETSQSGRLFGLNETDTRRLIDLIRNQKHLGPTTEKTTATWGSSSTGTSGSDDDGDQSPMARQDHPKPGLSFDRELHMVSDMDQINSVVGTTVKDAFTQLDRGQGHEIDFRPPTRRRRNLTQPEAKGLVLDQGSYSSTINKLQDDLISFNNTMRILVDDQLSLTKLLLNTLNLKQAAVPNNLCYGISPDFLIYQLDNCSAQFAATLKQTKDWQWQVYSLTKSADNVELHAVREPLAPLHFIAMQGDQEPTGSSRLQLRSPGRDDKVSKMPFQRATDCDETQISRGGQYTATAMQNGEATVETGNDLFEALRDSIYSEAAILISQNESRPHFLMELFHTLQQLNTDYLRQHALYTLQDVMKGYIPASPRKSAKKKSKGSSSGNRVIVQKKYGSFSENTPSESAATSEDEVYAKLKAKVPETSGYDFSLKVSSASECSTPDEDAENNPFAADDLGSTVIHLDAALRHMREMERIKQELQSSANGEKDVGGSDKQEKVESPQINTKVLRVWIKSIVSEIIPILKSNHDRIVDQKLVKLMQGKVLECVGKGMENQKLQNGSGTDETTNASGEVDKLSIADFFSGQLKSILSDSFAKFLGKKVASCGEDLIVGLSEILFNELAFFHMMQDLGKERQVLEKKKNIPIIRIERDESSSLKKQNEAESNTREKNSPQGPENENDSEVSGQEDDTPFANCDQVGSLKTETTEEAVTVDLSVSESKPLTSYGSGEDEEDGSGDEYEYKEQDVPTSMQQDSSEVQEKGDKLEEGENEPQISQDSSDQN